LSHCLHEYHAESEIEPLTLVQKAEMKKSSWRNVLKIYLQHEVSALEEMYGHFSEIFTIAGVYRKRLWKKNNKKGKNVYNSKIIRNVELLLKK
jgi:hypothetical protein